MIDFYFQVPLLCTRYSFKCESPLITREIELKIEKPIKLAFPYSYQNQEKKADVEIIGGIHEGIFASFKSIISDSEENALHIVREILQDVCIQLSIMAQMQMGESWDFHSYFYWEDRNVTIKINVQGDSYQREEEGHNVYLNLSDRLCVQEKITLKSTKVVALHDLGLAKEQMDRNPIFRFMANSFYAALGNKDIVSQSYRLFTIIECLEQNFTSDYSECTKPLIPEKQKERFWSDINNTLKKYGLENTRKEQISNRLKNAVNKATEKSRKEKLQYILKQRYNITYSRDDNNESSNANLLKEFIDMRNRLFHADTKGGVANERLSDLTSELFDLCRHIIFKEMKNGKN